MPSVVDEDPSTNGGPLRRRLLRIDRYWPGRAARSTLGLRHERTYDGQQRRYVTTRSRHAPTAMVAVLAAMAIARLPSSLSTVPVLVRSLGSTARCWIGRSTSPPTGLRSVPRTASASPSTGWPITRRRRGRPRSDPSRCTSTGDLVRWPQVVRRGPDCPMRPVEREPLDRRMILRIAARKRSRPDPLSNTGDALFAVDPEGRCGRRGGPTVRDNAPMDDHRRCRPFPSAMASWSLPVRRLPSAPSAGCDADMLSPLRCRLPAASSVKRRPPAPCLSASRAGRRCICPVVASISTSSGPPSMALSKPRPPMTGQSTGISTSSICLATTTGRRTQSHWSSWPTGQTRRGRHRIDQA